MEVEKFVSTYKKNLKAFFDGDRLVISMGKDDDIERLKQIIKEKGITYAEIGRIAKRSRERVRQVMTGNAKLSDRTKAWLIKAVQKAAQGEK